MAAVAVHLVEEDPMVEVVFSTMVHVSMEDDGANLRSLVVEVLYPSNQEVVVPDPAILDSNYLQQVTDSVVPVPNCFVVDVLVVAVAATCSVLQFEAPMIVEPE